MYKHANVYKHVYKMYIILKYCKLTMPVSLLATVGPQESCIQDLLEEFRATSPMVNAKLVLEFHLP